MNERNPRLWIGLFITLGIALASRAAYAQPENEPPGTGPANFGPQDVIVDEIGCDEILPTTGTNPYSATYVGGVLYRTTPGYFGSDVALGRIPNGARLLGFNIYYFSDNPDTPLEVSYCRSYVDSATGEPKGSECIASFFSPSPPPGPALGSLLVPAAFQTVLRNDDIDADGSPEAVQHSLHIFLSPNMGVHSIRPQWLRQVSPAPAVATFNDVPSTDAAFQFIEAMAASGVTVGCDVTPPRYCPDNFVTRREMAVFFAKALGLHWSPF